MPACGSCGAANPDRARFCLECGAALAATPAGETRKVVTILFCDVVGSTALGERADAETVRAAMGRYFELARHAIETHGGTVEKFIGDAVMAVFGIPQLHEDDPARAVRAGLAIQSGLEQLRRATDASYGAGLQTRIGITTGEVVVGPPGAQTLVTGDAVNTAARIEQAAPPGSVLIGELTERLTRGKIATTAIEPIEAKGKAGPVKAFRVDGLVEDLAAPTEAGKLIGRDADLARVLATVGRSVDLDGVQLLTIVAQPGVGKSRLMRAAERTLAAGTRVLRGRCPPYGDGIASWPIREAFRSAAGIEDGDASAEIVAKLAALAEPDPSATTVGTGVAQMMGVGGLGVGQDDAFWAVRRLLERLAEDSPLVTIFEDLHWADPVFLELLEYVLDLSSGAPITILASARPELLESRPSWAAGRPNAEVLRLGALDDEAAASLCRSLEGGDALPDRVVARIVEAAEGNPLFIEEMVASLHDDGVLRREASTWTMRGEEVAIPPSIKALLAARLDRLPDPTRMVVERGSVIGRIFETVALAQIAPEQLRASLTGHLLTLVRREFIRPARSDIGGGDAYAFRHALIRDAAYDSLSKRDRAELHERMATWLESVSGDQLSQFQEVIAFHLEQAHAHRLSLGETDKHTSELARRASAHLAAIGERSLVSGSLTAAVAAFRRALDLAGDPPPPMLLLNAGDTIARTGDPAGIELLREAVALAQSAGDAHVAAVASAVSSMFEVGIRVLTVKEAIPRVERAVAQLEPTNDHEGLARAKAALSYVLWGAGRLGDSGRLAEEVVEHWRAAGQPARVARAIALRSGTLVDGPSPVPDTIALCEGWLQEVGESPNARRILVESLAMLAGLDGRFDDARRLLGEARVLGTELGQVLDSLDYLVEGAEIEIDAGNLDAAEAILAGVPEQMDAFGTVQAPLAYAMLARIRTLRGDPAAGLRTLLPEPAEDDDVFIRSTWYRAAALARIGLGQLDDAERYALSAVDALANTDLLVHQADALAILGDVMAARGDVVAAREHLAAAALLYEQKQASARLTRARARLAELSADVPPVA